ncbi:sensor histidine kinase [Dinghuibacter silviterrae]|uniref:Oxygen sensor histidine kinase NreB n=1 Tax=Dinghuibacter silviterrae TaxID=1539049 RepID=A0A4V3GLL7_9BACT|nr:sensor histidine kinase [Dinghuibacter silviterrae]TDX00023.1 histidine kinase [Dinghuibacter silviterrae]
MGDKILYTTLLTGCLVGVILLFFVVSIIRYHRRYVRLQRDRILAEVTILENERKRIAGDLHDSLGPLLSTVKLNMGSIETENVFERQVLEKSGKYIDEIISNMREISYNLLPISLERKGLLEAVKEFIGHLNGTAPVRIQLHCWKEIAIPKEKEIHVFRMVQEIVHNTIKHSGARHLHIGISHESNRLLVMTKDDGHGFDAQKARETSGGLGLRSLESRAEILRGTLSIESKPQEGTRYYIEIPL